MHYSPPCSHKGLLLGKMKRKLKKGYYHEALDRTHVIECMIEDHLLKHKAVEKHKTIKVKVEKAMELLAEVYQDFGQLF